MTWFFAGLVLLRIAVSVFFVALVIRIGLGVRERMVGRRMREWRRRYNAGIRVLERRFASGEVTEEEYVARRAVLES